MSTIIALRLPWGRYHATPWDRSANEAAVEWPPSPWRLLRALYAVWCHRVADLPSELVTETLARLACAPGFHLPPHAEAHSRHYLPDNQSGTDKVLDAFVVTQRDAELLIRWDRDLTDDQYDALSRLSSLLPYLGRAESLCVAEVRLPGTSVPSDGWLEPGAHGDIGNPTRRVLVPEEPLDVGALTVTTQATRKSGLRIPAGSRWVTYPAPAPYDAPGSSSRHRSNVERTDEAALLALDSPALPSVYDTMWLADITRRAALRCHVAPTSMLSGKDAAGNRLQGHRHAHYLPLDLDNDQLLDAVLVWAPGGLRRSELAALGRIRRLYGPPGFRPVRAALSAVGRLTDLLEPTGTGTDWLSATPFLPYRHRKRQTMEQFLTEELRRDAATRQLPTVSVVGVVPGAWLNYRRSRPGRAPEVPGFGLHIRFAEAVTGPVVLGSMTHFGMGRFERHHDV